MFQEEKTHLNGGEKKLKPDEGKEGAGDTYRIFPQPSPPPPPPWERGSCAPWRGERVVAENRGWGFGKKGGDGGEVEDRKRKREGREVGVGP